MDNKNIYNITDEITKKLGALQLVDPKQILSVLQKHEQFDIIIYKKIEWTFFNGNLYQNIDSTQFYTKNPCFPSNLCIIKNNIDIKQIINKYCSPHFFISHDNKFEFKETSHKFYDGAFVSDKIAQVKIQNNTYYFVLKNCIDQSEKILEILLLNDKSVTKYYTNKHMPRPCLYYSKCKLYPNVIFLDQIFSEELQCDCNVKPYTYQISLNKINKYHI